MLGQSKPFASLSSTLLARKGHARPAMRPQGYAGSAPATQLEDLGWNDMGPAEQDAPPPPVLVQREGLRTGLQTPPEPPKAAHSVSVATAGRLQRETAHAGRAAFTLRLDAERHLQLRLASAVTHRSAQQLVSHALDRFLTTLPEVGTLIAQLPAPKRTHR